MSRIRASEALLTRPDGIDETAVVSVFRVPPESAGQRLDIFMRGELRRTSRTRTQEIIKSSAYDAKGRALRSNHRVQPFQDIVLWRPAWDETPVPTDIAIVYEDEHLLAVNKAPNLPVHPTARYHKNTLIKLLQGVRPGTFLSLGHRLDRETSGVILVSKSSACDRALKKAFARRDDIEKTYVAFTWGVPRGVREHDTMRHELSLELDPTSSYKVKMRPGETETAMYAATRFTLEEAAATRDGKTYARVRCDLETGRQHQIRVHLASLGAPIVGDKLYGPDETAFARGADGTLTADDLIALELPRHALHAAALSMQHPMTGELLSITAALPQDLAEFWESLVTAREAPCPSRPDQAPHE